MAKKAKTEEEIAAFRERVCDAATRLFTERGPQNVTMRQIAAEVGVSAMTPYRYFQDKDEILATVRAAAFDQFSNALEKAMAEAPDARAKARAVGDAYVAFAHANPAAYQLIFSFTQPDEERFPELVRANSRAQQTMVSYVQDMIAAGLLQGDAQLIGYMFWATLHGIVVLELASGLRGMDGNTLREKIMRTLYAGMQAHPPTLDD
ncbi:transcriptional regulator, TetR family protein [Alcanivorax hongdengensis A-11-3]|uniref:Transcriptional regulator, TetR family protein n=1 Tax=Alcanivorax hongdengensis A-11-3 TaxID=1177179 RepID=L0W9V5_9GAMM|nr:TetR/AcrR family transcriptional regulator [Alcanivorax hongdengensis]EKF73746.1 transcriptional regulator, TetR family protein [Alcanivorax hongdengensis A-11-3]